MNSDSMENLKGISGGAYTNVLQGGVLHGGRRRDDTVESQDVERRTDLKH